MRLFIIGNGYDLSRRGDTGYCCFKKWLKDNYIKDLNFNPFYKDGNLMFSSMNSVSSFGGTILRGLLVPETDEQNERIEAKRKDVDETRKKLACAILFYSMKSIDDLEWNDFENDLSKLPFQQIIESFKAYNFNNGADLCSLPGSPVDREIEIISSLPSVITSLFSEWICSLKQMEVKKREFESKTINQLRESDVFIIFNYTKTIEEIFNNSNPNLFFHIHGTADKKDSIVVGHNDKNKSDLNKPLNSLDSDGDYIRDAYDCLYKHPEKVIKSNCDLWNKISEGTEYEFYEFGWSCSDTDRDYLEKIIKIVKDKQYRVHLNDYNDLDGYKKKQWVKYGASADSISYYHENDK